ncbi:Clathrin adaptor complex small chain [Metschnikowia aff. pulcherrima]|uniref:Coatomer subunit zeta n=1 Tax=Metschnikowia aff. pulcherrima TaxID=2163413 RepID=A0A4P6XYD6_9ASCO|nr:Clathrin adaptor complex small chain [Metschnikowia aff. pulcherrima]
MSLNISLYTVSAALILGPEGQRLYAKYYQLADTPQSYQTSQQQAAFEKAVYAKIHKQHQDVLLYDNHLITYKQTNDVILVIVLAVLENELMLFSLTNNIHEALTILLGNTLDKTTVLLKYDMVCLCMDETIDDGIIIEIDPAIIVSRVTNPPSGSAVANDMNLNIDLSEKGLFNALSFASKKISERLQQGL